MKNLLLILFVAVTAVTYSCKKENAEQKSFSRLQGTWELQKRVSIEIVNGKETDRDESPYDPGALNFVFKGDTLFLEESGRNTEKYPFRLVGDSLKLDQGREDIRFKLRWDSNTRVILSLTDSSTRNNILTLDIDEFHLNKK